MASIIEGFVQGVDDIQIAKKFNTLDFQLKYYVNAMLKKKIDLGKEFYETYDKFQTWEKKIQNFLSIKHMMNHKTKLLLYNTE